ncbi:Uncharacterised protein [Leclercia adecarboxylata]|uniref:Uncharacterized protein n=1 Tax=Leclercia adecarboxylata TaxID=83655 RepID=A0A4U9HHT2_9ENTR|nr:Uncharacterised protein [Leclercia adecarboxylata]
MIYAAYANASLYALRSASHKLLNYAQNAREYLDFRYQGLTVAFDELQHNITRLEDDMALLHSRQASVSDEVRHEVSQALSATDLFFAAQQSEIKRAIGHVFDPDNMLDLAGFDPHKQRADAAATPGQLVLEDEGQAQILLSKIRSACELIMLDAQAKIGRELALRFDQLESTLARALNDAMRRLKRALKRS